MLRWTPEQVSDFRREWESLDHDAARASAWKKVHRTLPRRVQARLWWNRTVTGAAIWLVDRRRYAMAEWLWRASSFRPRARRS